MVTGLCTSHSQGGKSSTSRHLHSSHPCFLPVFAQMPPNQVFLWLFYLQSCVCVCTHTHHCSSTYQTLFSFVAHMTTWVIQYMPVVVLVVVEEDNSETWECKLHNLATWAAKLIIVSSSLNSQVFNNNHWMNNPKNKQITSHWLGRWWVAEATTWLIFHERW